MIEQAKKLRDDNHYTCVVLDEAGYIFYSVDKGVLPLYQLNQKELTLSNQSVLADKVIGKAAAILAIRLGIRRIDTRLLSEEGKSLLELYAVSYTYETLVPRIDNRFHTDQCPMEKALDGITSIDEGWQVVDTFIQNREKRGNR